LGAFNFWAQALRPYWTFLCKTKLFSLLVQVAVLVLLVPRFLLMLVQN
jgi:hypothetical protein